jgi:UDP-2-acetamido-2-deoxy-ribo-hexuluronate aminotransferase
MIRFVDLKQQDKIHKKKILNSIKKILNRTDYINGHDVTKFEETFNKKYNFKYSSLVSSGTDALYLSLKTLAKKFKSGEIITTPFTFFATSEIIINAGFTPVFADIDKETYNILPKSISEKINKRTIGIIPVHIFGYPCDMQNIIKIAKLNKLFVIEDCAQATGASINNKFVGSFGDINAFSFYPTKNLGAYGDAGLISTKSKKYYDYINLLKTHGAKKPYIHEIVGENSRCDSIQAAVLNEKIVNYNRILNKRKICANLYFKNLKNVKEIILPRYKKNFKSVYHQFTILVKNRNRLKEFLEKNKINSMIYYDKPLYKQPFYKKKIKLLKNTEYVCKHCISLPIHPSLNKNQIIKICEKIKFFYKKL